MLSLELIDAGLLLAQARGEHCRVVGEGPGMAILEESATQVGLEAARRIRLKPLLAHSNFWRGLSTDPLVRPSRLAGTTADIAFVQLNALLEPCKSQGESVLLAIPAGYGREQLGLLLGIVNETGVPVAGLVDAALAACSHEPVPSRVLHLDIELHQALLSVMDYVGGEHPGLRRSRYEIAPQHGALALQQAWMKMIAENFIRKTRFDPLHDAAMEQQLADQLPEWLGQLRRQQTVTVQLQHPDRELEIELEQEQFMEAAQQHYGALLKLVQDARVAGMPIELRISHRVALLPGIVERFATLRDCEVRILRNGAAALGALLHTDAIKRSTEALALVYQLPVPRTAAAEAAIAEPEATPAQLRPTHVLYQGRAWRISERPLSLGWAVQAGRRALILPSAAPGLSRSHCTLVRRHGSVVVEDHSTYGSYVNDEKVVGSTALAVGDRLRLGSPGVTVELIQLVNDDGAPQD